MHTTPLRLADQQWWRDGGCHHPLHPHAVDWAGKQAPLVLHVNATCVRVRVRAGVGVPSNDVVVFFGGVDESPAVCLASPCAPLADHDVQEAERHSRVFATEELGPVRGHGVGDLCRPDHRVHGVEVASTGQAGPVPSPHPHAAVAAEVLLRPGPGAAIRGEVGLATSAGLDLWPHLWSASDVQDLAGGRKVSWSDAKRRPTTTAQPVVPDLRYTTLLLYCSTRCHCGGGTARTRVVLAVNSGCR